MEGRCAACTNGVVIFQYICKNIIFKFARDVWLDGIGWMYGGRLPNDEKAMKATKYELKVARGLPC